MAILPLPVFEEELKAYEDDKKVYEALKIPKTLVVRFGFMKMVGEFPYQGDLKPGCGSKIVVRTHRGVEIGEMLTSTCPNSGCSKSVSRKEMLEYIQNSGGRDYPFFEHGRALRVATDQDMHEQTRIEQSKHPMRLQAKAIGERLNFGAKVVEIEPILGGDQVCVYYHSEDRVDFRELAAELQREWKTRIEMRQVGARDEARLTADYERCGQHCCCKNFLKVLKPVSMRSAKVQKATLDPLKISGRCGRLMCCLRYEDSTYEDLRKRLPKNKSRVGTPDGDGMVIDSQILTQLVLVRLDVGDKDVAVAVEDLTPPLSATPPVPTFAPGGGTGGAGGDRGRERPGRDDRAKRDDRSARDARPSRDSRDARPNPAPAPGTSTGTAGPDAAPPDGEQTRPAGPPRQPRRDSGSMPARPQRPEPERGPPVAPVAPAAGGDEGGAGGTGESEINLDDIETDFGDGPKAGPSDPSGEGRRRKRRRRRRGGGGPGGAAPQGGATGGPPGGAGGGA